MSLRDEKQTQTRENATHMYCMCTTREHTPRLLQQQKQSTVWRFRRSHVTQGPKKALGRHDIVQCHLVTRTKEDKMLNKRSTKQTYLMCCIYWNHKMSCQYAGKSKCILAIQSLACNDYIISCECEVNVCVCVCVFNE